MEFSVKKFDLLEELSLTQGVVERKTTMPILSNLLCEAKGNRNHAVFRLACHSEARRCLSGEESLCVSKRQPAAWLFV